MAATSVSRRLVWCALDIILYAVIYILICAVTGSSVSWGWCAAIWIPLEIITWIRLSPTCERYFDWNIFRAFRKNNGQ